MASNPSFAATPKFKNIVVNSTNGGDSAYINPTTIATVLTIGSSGAIINSVYVKSLGSNASCMVRFFVDTVGTGGTNNVLIYESFLSATTSSTVAAVPSFVWSPGLVLPASAVLRATLANTALTIGAAVSVEYGEF